MPIMKQASLGFGQAAKRTRKREFLESMDRVVPWADLVALMALRAPEAGHRGRHPFAGRGDAAHPLHAALVHAERPRMKEALHATPLSADYRLMSSTKRLGIALTTLMK